MTQIKGPDKPEALLVVIGNRGLVAELTGCQVWPDAGGLVLVLSMLSCVL